MMFPVLIMAMVLWACACVKTYQIVHLEYVHLILCQLELNRAVSKHMQYYIAVRFHRNKLGIIVCRITNERRTSNTGNPRSAPLYNIDTKKTWMRTGLSANNWHKFFFF